MSDYKKILESVNWPTDILLIDFETFYDVDYTLSKMSTIEFIMDSRFEFTGVGWAVSESFRPEFRFEVEQVCRIWQRVHGENLEKCTVVVKNTKFDITILVEKFGINPPYIIDIDDLLRHYDSRMSHRMKDVTKMFGLQDKGDTSNFKGLRLLQMSPEKVQELKRYSYDDIDIEAKLFKKLMPELSNPTVEIPLARHNLDLYLVPVLGFDFEKADKLSRDMDKILADILKPTGRSKNQISKNTFIKYLEDALPTGEEVPMKQGKNKMIPALSKEDVAFQQLLVHKAKEVRDLCAARKAVKSWPLHSKRIINMITQARVSHNLLRVPLHYYGCHTGRYSGGEKINLHNLGGRGRAGMSIHPLIQKVRKLIKAVPGMLLVSADSSQIEARVLAWLACQTDLVEDFANGEDIYSIFASELFNSYVAKPCDDDPEPIKEILKIRRGFGKDAILGCGFGMGANKFYDRCLSNQDLRPLFDSGKYTRTFIKSLIKTYRTKYNKIPTFWKATERAFKNAIKYGDTIHPVTGYCFHNSLNFYSKGSTVFIELPSTRTLRYRHCSLDRDRAIRWHYGHLWGGSITENIVQAVARDLLAYWIMECESFDLPICYHCHDSLTSTMPEDTADQSLKLMLEIVRSKPDWADGLPLDAEGKISETFTV